MKTHRNIEIAGALCFVGMLLSANAQALNKCIDGKSVTYQDAPCPDSLETPAQIRQRELRNERLHDMLEELQAKGEGKVDRSRPAVEKNEENDSEQPRKLTWPRGDRERIRQEWAERINRQTAENNARSAQQLDRFIESAERACGGPLLKQVWIGMSDEQFRNCTYQVRFGLVEQIVVAQHEAMPLRLYVFGTGTYSRVYSVNRVVSKFQLR